MAKTTDDDVEMIATMMIDRGTADEMAVLAYRLKQAAEYHADAELLACFQVLRRKTISRAGIPDEYDHCVDAAIESIGQEAIDAGW